MRNDLESFRLVPACAAPRLTWPAAAPRAGGTTGCAAGTPAHDNPRLRAAAQAFLLRVGSRAGPAVRRQPPATRRAA